MREFEHGGDIYSNSIQLDFSVNTNPIGMSRAAKAAAARAAARQAHVYPDTECRELRAAIAEKEGVSEEGIICACGASELIFAAVRACMPKKALLIAPTFSEYERALMSVGSDIEYYLTAEEKGFRIGSDFIDRLSGVDMIFICNPNNPTGNIVDKPLMDRISEKCAGEGITCVVDECFAELAGGYSMTGKTPVIKAFTKTYAMAGLRLGYMVADKAFICRVKEQLPAWNVSQPAQAAGVAALADSGYLRKSIKYIRKERVFLSRALENLGFKVFDSKANFILLKCEAGLFERLLRRGILIRDCENFKGLGRGFYRVAVKRHGENVKLIRELGEICG